MPDRGSSKIELRSAMRAVCSRLDARWVKAASGRVSDGVNALLDQVNDVEHLLAFAAFFPGEVDLGAVVERQLRRGLRVYMPRTLVRSRESGGSRAPLEHSSTPRLTEGPSLEFCSVNLGWMEHAVAGAKGVLEPAPGSGHGYDRHAAPSTVVLVPGLAFDLRGGRLGRGKGYYDRFLSSSLMHRARFFAVGWDLQVVREVPMQSHDVFMHRLITESGAHICAPEERSPA